MIPLSINVLEWSTPSKGAIDDKNKCGAGSAWSRRVGEVDGEYFTGKSEMAEQAQDWATMAG